MQLIPNSYGTFIEFNPCHNPSGPGGGRFCDRDAFVRPATPSASKARDPLQVLAEPYGRHGSALVAAAQQLVARTRADGHEHMAILQPGDEYPRHFTSHSAKFVRFPDDVDMDTPPIFEMHTHPTGSAPSEGDIRAQVAFKARRGIILGAGGEWYELEVTDMDAAKQALGEGRRATSWYVREAKGKFTAAFNRAKGTVLREARQLTDEWAAKQYGWTRHTFLKTEGFMIPKDPHVDSMEGGPVRFIDRKEAGTLHPEMRQYFSDRFSERSPRIWLTLAQKYPWITFRYHRETGPYATTAAH